MAQVRRDFLRRKHRIHKTTGSGWKGHKLVVHKPGGSPPPEAGDAQPSPAASPSHIRMTNVERSGASSLAKASALAMGAVNTRDNIVRKSAKATFLAQLEEFVEQELQVQGVEKSGPGVEPSAIRLQVYREAVQFFMEEFKTCGACPCPTPHRSAHCPRSVLTGRFNFSHGAPRRRYKPFLSAVCHEYEALLQQYQQKLHFIPPLKARLTTLQQEAGHVRGVGWGGGRARASLRRAAS